MTVKLGKDPEMNTVPQIPKEKTADDISAEKRMAERIKNHEEALKVITQNYSYNVNPAHQPLAAPSDYFVEKSSVLVNAKKRLSDSTKPVVDFIDNMLMAQMQEENKDANVKNALYPRGETFLGDVDFYPNAVLCDIVAGPFAGNLLDITDQSSIKIVPRHQSNGFSII